jgi:hypothetical protein
MNSWQSRIKKYNEENNIVTLPFQSGGEIQNSNVPLLKDPYFDSITLNNKTYSLKDKQTMQILKKIIMYYNKKYE